MAGTVPIPVIRWRTGAGVARVKSALRAALWQPLHKADVSPDMAHTTSPIPSFRPVWDHLPVVHRRNSRRRLQGRDSQTTGIHGLRVSRPDSRSPPQADTS